MGCLSIIHMGSAGLWMFLFSYSFFFFEDPISNKGIVWIDGKRKIAETNDAFVCATIDLWACPAIGTGCLWENSSLFTVDLNNKVFKNSVKAFSPLMIRAGGLLQDKLTYQTEYSDGPCDAFIQNNSALYSFNDGCLPLSRWDELNRFFQDTKAEVVFGLNELKGKTLLLDNGSAIGAWDSTNAESLIRYTLKKNYTIYGWELGNELSDGGIEVGVSAADYVVDITTLRDMMHRVYKDIEPKPLLIAPGGFLDRYSTDKIWYTELLNKTRNTLDAVSHHIYDLGDGTDENLTAKILDPSNLDKGNEPYEVLNSILKNTASPASSLVTESGGAYHGGHANVSDAFVFSFWFLDQLGMSSVYNTKTYCRQSLVGGNYGLLNTITYEPNPDYYSALLFHRLMGSKVLSTSFEGTNKIRAYSHCAKESKGITILLINLDNGTSIIDVNLSVYNTRRTKMSERRKQIREEYHLTAKDGNLHSKVMLLNGKELSVDSSGDIPLLTPLYVNSSEPITVAPFSIVFVHFPHFTLYACRS